MNHSSVINTLLGVHGNNAASTKTTASKAREDSAERFQETMQRVRPDIAAREKVLTKRPEVVKPRAPEMREKASGPVSSPAGHSATSKVPEAPDKTASVKHVPATQKDQATQSTYQSDATSDANSVVTAEGDSDTGTQADTTSTTESQFDIGLSSPEEEVLITENPVTGLLVIPTGEEGVGIGPLQTLELTDAQPATDGQLDIDSLLIPPDSNAALAPELEEVALAAAGAVPANVVQGGTVLADTRMASAAVPLPAGASLDVDGMMTDGLAANAVDADTAGDTMNSDSQAPVEELLTSAKTAFGKLLEASTNAGSDSPKPATAPGNPALDVLTRLSETQTSPAARAFVVQTGVPVTVGQPQWSQAVGDKVLWLAAQNVSAAEIRLDPPDLGPMHVKVSVNQDQATVSFTSPHPVVREALDQQLNRLREMFAEQGLNLNVDVSDKSFAQQEREKNASGASAGTTVDDEDDLQPVATTSAIAMRLVDHYA